MLDYLFNILFYLLCDPLLFKRWELSIILNVYLLCLQGYSDLGFMEGNENLHHVTPFMGQYSTARSSMVLKNYYVMPNGHSTRSALLTGKHPAMLGEEYIVT